MTEGPDYAYIQTLELELFGEVFTPTPEGWAAREPGLSTADAILKEIYAAPTKATSHQLYVNGHMETVRQPPPADLVKYNEAWLGRGSAGRAR
jgi:hypothetical protein